MWPGVEAWCGRPAAAAVVAAVPPTPAGSSVVEVTRDLEAATTLSCRRRDVCWASVCGQVRWVDEAPAAHGKAVPSAADPADDLESVVREPGKTPSGSRSCRGLAAIDGAETPAAWSSLARAATLTPVSPLRNPPATL